MVIANPIYDAVFKRLMEDNRIAKFFIGTLLEQIIESVEVKPQEFTPLAPNSVSERKWLCVSDADKKLSIQICYVQ